MYIQHAMSPPNIYRTGVHSVRSSGGGSGSCIWAAQGRRAAAAVGGH